MKRLLIAVLVIFSGFSPVLSEDFNPDSLKQLIPKSNDKEAFELLLSLSEHYSIQKIADSAGFYIARSLEMAEKIGDLSFYGRAKLEEGKIFLRKRDLENSILSLEAAKDYFHDAGDIDGIMKTNLTLGTHFQFARDIEKAISVIEESLELFSETDNNHLKAKVFYSLCGIFYSQNEKEKAIRYAKKSLEYRKLEQDSEKIAVTMNTLGGFYSSVANFDSSVVFYQGALEYYRELGNKRSTGITLNNLGNQYLQLGQYDEAIRYYEEATSLFKEIDFVRGIAATLTGMAVIYEGQKQFDAALSVYQEVLEYTRRGDNRNELANTLSNVAVTYSKLLNDSLENSYGPYYMDTIYIKRLKPQIEYGNQSVEYNLQALQIRQELENLRGVGITLTNLGSVYQSMGEFEKANIYFQEWFSLPEDTQERDTRVVIAIGMGRYAMYKSNYSQAISYFDQAYELAVEMNKKIYIQEATRNLADLYEKVEDYNNALKYFQEYHYVYDSLNQETSKEQVNEMMVKYETAAKEKQNELLRKDQIIKDSQLKNTRKALLLVLVAVLVFVLLLILLVHQNRLRKRTNEELESKNKVITGQTREITASIQYAQRIQIAAMPPREFLEELFPDHFLLFRPRNIVSGDFFWTTRKDGQIITMVADCTGHGVPGAFLSMLSIAFLNEIVSKSDNLSADLILNELRSKIIDSLHQTDEPGGTQDGMDAALFIYEPELYKLQFAGALNPMVIIRNGEMEEIKGDQMPIGIHTFCNNPFTLHERQMEKGDMIYTYSDGYADQFGGPNDKKFMTRRFKRVLLEIHEQTTLVQKKFLESTLDEWKGDTFQVDDILVLGIRV